jgi:hypothetical protein
MTERAQGVDTTGQYWRLADGTNLKGKELKAHLLQHRTDFLTKNGVLLEPDEGLITKGGGQDAPLSNVAPFDQKELKKKRSLVAMNFFAIKVASWTRSKEQWTADASALEAQKELALEQQIEADDSIERLATGAANPNDPKAEEREDRAIEARQVRIPKQEY